MNKYEDLIIYKENRIDIGKKIPYHKKLSVNAILVNPFDEISEEILDNVFNLNKVLIDSSMRLIVEIDLCKTLSNLINEKIGWTNPKARKSIYQFINYLEKYGIRSFYYRNLERAFGDGISDNEFISYARELIKNTRSKSEVLSIAELINPTPNLANSLSANNYLNFDFVSAKETESLDFVELKKAINNFQSKSSGKDINLILTSKSQLESYTNPLNYPYYSQSLLAGTIFFLKGGLILEEFEELGIFQTKANRKEYDLIRETNDTLSFYKEILSIRKNNDVLLAGSYRILFPKDERVFAYERIYKGEKIIVFANFSQNEVLLDIRFHFIDLYDFAYLIGNYGKRRIVKNLLLRPYEFISFTKT